MSLGLYCICLPRNEDIKLATYTDDSALLTVEKEESTTAETLQNTNKIEWTKNG